MSTAGLYSMSTKERESLVQEEEGSLTRYDRPFQTHTHTRSLSSSSGIDSMESIGR